MKYKLKKSVQNHASAHNPGVSIHQPIPLRIRHPGKNGHHLPPNCKYENHSPVASKSLYRNGNNLYEWLNSSSLFSLPQLILRHRRVVLVQRLGKVMRSVVSGDEIQEVGGCCNRQCACRRGGWIDPRTRRRYICRGYTGGIAGAYSDDALNYVGVPSDVQVTLPDPPQVEPADTSRPGTGLDMRPPLHPSYSSH